MTDQTYKIALSLLPKIGPRLARNLVSYIGSIEGIFKEKKSLLEKVPGIGKLIAQGFSADEALKLAEQELKYIEEKDISWCFYLDSDYPHRLKECEDSPIVLYYRGKPCFNAPKVVSIVGTRNSTEYGEELCNKLVHGLAEEFPNALIVSGFAYGIDICAHRAALNAGLNTAAVFGSGIDRIYPSLHKKYLKQVLEQGCTCSEFPSTKKPDPGNFVSRNRIIAGLADAVVVVESGVKGGSLLTADMAQSYNRDVFAFPGRIDDTFSKGCNQLIRNNQAALIESYKDLILQMRWDTKEKQKPVQKSLFNELDTEELEIAQFMKKNSITLNELAKNLDQPLSKISAHLLNMEFKGLVKALPGNAFRLNL